MNRIVRYLVYVMFAVSLVFLGGCKKVHVVNNDNASEFVDEYYEYLADNKQGFIALDLRNLDPDYASGHLKGFKSYQYYIARNHLEPDTVYNERISSTFIRWMEQNYNKDLTVFLIDKDGSVVSQAAVKLKGIGYKNIYIYTSGYDTIVNYLNDKIEIVTGVDDCGC